MNMLSHRQGIGYHDAQNFEGGWTTDARNRRWWGGRTFAILISENNLNSFTAVKGEIIGLGPRINIVNLSKSVRVNCRSTFIYK